MNKVILTCKNHPELRWTTKEIAWSNGRYNGQRHIHFIGSVNDTFPNYAPECDCKASDLIEVLVSNLMPYPTNPTN